MGTWVVLSSLALSLFATPGLGGTNQATGDIGGVGSQLVDSNVLTLNATSKLALVKRAYLPDGTRVPAASTLPKGSAVDFLIYVNNNSALQVNDVSVQDVLDAAFAYQTGSIRVDNSVASCAAVVCTPAEEDNVFAVVAAKPPSTDLVDGDVASYAVPTTTVTAGNESVANLRLDLAAQRVWAMVFTVRIP